MHNCIDMDGSQRDYAHVQKCALLMDTLQGPEMHSARTHLDTLEIFLQFDLSPGLTVNVLAFQCDLFLQLHVGEEGVV